MKKDTITQFVCFITNLDLDEFAPGWERYAKRLANNKSDAILQQQSGETKTKFRYISQHEWPERDFDFTFMNNRRSEHFPEHNVRVVQAGGYIPLQFKKKHPGEDSDTKLIAFVSHNETELDFYHRLPFYRHLNIHQAYYESCAYGYVIEFFVPEKDTDELLLQLKQRPGIETGIYKECLVPHV